MLPVINPHDVTQFWRRNVIMTGSGDRNTPVRTFAGPVSIKSALVGQIDWRTPDALHRVYPDTFVMLNDGQEYVLSTEADGECRTFCTFFERGFVESTICGLVASDETMLDAPDLTVAYGFFEQVTAKSSSAGREVTRMAKAVAANASPVVLDWLFHDLAEAVARGVVSERRRPERLSALRAAIRSEIHGRLMRARAAIEDELARPWTLGLIAREAAMAPHHFHRCFSQCFGETPRRFLTRRRLERADALIGSGRFSVTQACFEVGYLSVASFSLAYSAHFGLPPSARRPAAH